jgi:acyl-CoA dehydrogenase
MSIAPSNLAEGEEWPLSTELLELRAMVRDFVANEVRPREQTLDPDALTLAPDDLALVQEKAKQAGLWCVASPEEYGGTGLGLLAQAVVAEEAARCRTGLEAPAAGAFGYDPPSVIFGGTAEQIEKFAVPTIAKGGTTFVALTEPNGGSDPARSIQTVAVRDGDEWVLNGSKLFISGADTGDWGVVFARTDRAAGRSGISCFIADTGRPGFQATPIPVIRSWYPCEVSFIDYRIPGDQLLGVEGEGFGLAQKWLGHGRVRYAAVVLGVAAEAIMMAVDYARTRQTFGGPLADKQGISFSLADCEVELRAARLLVYAAAIKADLGQPFQVDASIAKLYATEAAGRIVDRCIQVFGGMGVSKELPLERWYRELRVKRIGEGPSEVHRMVISRSMLGGRAR